MKIREFFAPSDAKYYAHAHKRLSTIPLSQVVDWSFQTNIAVQQAIEAVGRDRDRAGLEEMRSGAVALLAAADVLDAHLD